MNPSKPRLLVVDDDRAVLSTLVAGLARAGFDVVVATNGDEAMRMAVDVHPVLAVLDAEMQGRNGFAVAEFLQRETRVPFLFLLSPRDDAGRGRAAALGAAGVATKPVNMTKLVPAIRAALDRGHVAPPAETQAVAPPARAQASLLDDTLGGGHGPQTLIAIGILAERHRLNCDEAVRILHERAAGAGVSVDEVALAVIEQAESAIRPPV